MSYGAVWRRVTASPPSAQLSDVELECDGLLTYDRVRKFGAADTARIAAANRRFIESCC